MIALAFLLHYILKKENWIWLSSSALFTFFSFFTKQDGGGMALALCLTLLIYHCIKEKKWIPLLQFGISFLFIALAMILPLTKYSFSYWFNHGQPPHTARVSVFDIVDEFFAFSQWIKFYLFVMALLVMVIYKNRRELLTQKRSTVFLLLTLGILVEASILQVTSYTPPDNNIFFHSFAMAFILSFLARYLNLNFFRTTPLIIGCLGLLLWWSGVFWKYVQRVAQRMLPDTESSVATTENIVNRHTYLLNRIDSTEVPMSQWTFSNLKSFNRIYMPGPTVEGIDRLMHSSIVKNKNLKMLNMSELTPLTAELGSSLDTGPAIPLWYHLGVSMFNREASQYEQRIRQKQYDLVLFEYVPSLNNFYPFRVRDVLLTEYQKIDSFPAPRRGDTQGTIEVFVKP